MAFVILGLAVVFAPRLFVALLATALFCLGAGLCFLAWKFLQFRRKLQNLARDFENQARQDPRFSSFDPKGGHGVGGHGAGGQGAGSQSGKVFEGVRVISSYTVSGSSSKKSDTEGSEDDYEATKSLDKDGNITYH